MASGLDIDAPEKLPADYRKTLRVAVFLVAVLGPPFWFVYGIDQGLKTHLRDLDGKRREMDDYVFEERSARCSIARNVYELCASTGVRCEPVEARCERRTGR